MLQIQSKIEEANIQQMDLVHDRGIIITEEDRISNLPIDIIHHILSFFDMKYAIQTTTLSKKWKHIWTSMPHLNLNSQMFRTLPEFAKFVKHVLSNRNHQTQVSAVELTFRGLFNQHVIKKIANYAYSHNVRRMNIIRFIGRSDKTPYYVDHDVFPQCFCFHTLKHLTIATNEQWYYGGCISESTWDFPALETLSLSNLQFRNVWVDKTLDLFFKCVNLKDLSLHRFSMSDLDIFYVCAPKLSNLTITDADSFPKVFNVVAPQLENLTASVGTSINLRSRVASNSINSYNFLQLSTKGLDSLEKVNLSLPMSTYFINIGYAPQLLDLFRKLSSAKFLILDTGIIEALSSCLDQLSHEPCPFNNLKCLKQKDCIPSMPIQVRNYLLESSPSATFIMDSPQVRQKRSRQEVDNKGMAKKLANLEEEKQPKTMDGENISKSRQEVCKGTMALSSCSDQLSHEPSSFNNLKCLNQTDPISRMPTVARNPLFESSPSDTCIMDLSQETNKQIVEVVQEKVFQEQDLLLQPLDEVADEQENIIHNGLCEPQYLENENGTFEEGTSLINISVQEMEEGGVPANPEEQNQSEIGKDKNLGEKVSMSTHIDDTGNETQSVELANDKDQTDTNGTTKKGKLKRLKSETRNSKRGKKQKINKDTQLQTSSETSLKQHNNVIEGDSNEQNQIIEVNMTEIPIQYENVVEESVDDVEEDVEKDGETIQESHPDNSGQIQMEKSSDPYPILLKNKHPGRRFLTRSQIKTISKKDASVRPEIMESSNHANVPNDEHSPEEKQPVIETKQLSSAVSTQMNGQRAKLRSSQKNTDHLETKQKSRSPSLETPLKELLNPKCTKKLGPQFPDLNESETEVQESGSSQQDQQPNELEAKPKYKGRGRRPKYKGRAISKKCLQSAEKCKVLSKHPKPKRDEDKSTDFIQKVKYSHVKKGKQKDQSEQQPNEEDEAKDNGHGRHKMMRRSSRKEKDSNS